MSTLLSSVVLGFAVSAGSTTGSRSASLNFSTPSRNILCWAIEPAKPAGDVECVVLSTFGGPQDYPKSGYLPVRGRAVIRRSTNAGDIADARKHPVPYGGVWRRGFLRCISRRSGLTCMSTYASPSHGFFVSRDSQRAW